MGKFAVAPAPQLDAPLAKLSRKALFRRAREVGAKVHVSMTNDQLDQVVAQAEGR